MILIVVLGSYLYINDSKEADNSSVPTQAISVQNNPSVIMKNQDGSGESTFTVRQLLENAQVTIPDTGATVSLVDGKGEFDAGDGTAGIIELGNVFAKVSTGENDYDLYGVINVNYGGSGTFVYIVLLHATSQELNNTSSVPIEDRVIVKSIVPSSENPQSTNYKIEVNYLGREESETMAQDPTIPMKLYFPIDNHKFAK